MAFRKRKRETKPPPLAVESTFEKMLHNDAIGAFVLIAAAGVAFLLANLHWELSETSLSEWYSWLWEVHLGVSLHNFEFDKTLHLWINDGLMAIFFLFVGLEIKRELLIGELASVRKAVLPIAAAIGGMAVPALLYAALNYGGEGIGGWGIPMATDIAFAAGVIGLLSKRVPAALAVFLVALAIVDDLGAVAVIALFYTETIEFMPLVIGLCLLVISYGCSLFGFRSAVFYTLMAVGVWAVFLDSGVHATVAGVLFAFTVPLDATYETPLFANRIRTLIRSFENVEDHVNRRLVNARQQRTIRAIENECIHVEAPLQRMENKLHPFTAFLIMPIFAFANAGVAVDFGNIGQVLQEPVALGILAGLVIGKQAGVFGFAFIAVKAGLAELPRGVGWMQVWGVGWLAGIGFTMSLFIGQLAFGGGHGGHGGGHDAAHAVSDHLVEAKVAILLASLIAGVVGTLILYLGAPNPEEITSADEVH